VTSRPVVIPLASAVNTPSGWPEPVAGEERLLFRDAELVRQLVADLLLGVDR
jgi:hypothetical protein